MGKDTRTWKERRREREAGHGTWMRNGDGDRGNMGGGGGEISQEGGRTAWKERRRERGKEEHEERRREGGRGEHKKMKSGEESVEKIGGLL